MTEPRPLQIAIILAAGGVLYLVSPLDMEPTLFVVIPLCGALLGAVVSKKRPKTGAAIGFFGPLLVAGLFAVFVIWMLLRAKLPT